MMAILATLLVLHLDFNSVQMKKEAVVDALHVAANAGYNAVLWEIENKVRWESCPECVDAEAFTKEEFRAILAEAERLGLEPIPLMQTFGHAEYVLRHPKYAPLKEDPNFIACYCVSNPEVVRFQKALLHEYLDLFGPKVRRFHFGGDEAYRFGTCPKCRTRKRMELYSEHLQRVAEELRERGIRPGVWSDMVLMGGDFKHYHDIVHETLGALPRDFTLWHWDYAYNGRAASAKPPRPTCPQKVAALTGAGYEVILAGATHSWGDSPFLPRYAYHRDNLAACAALVRERRLAGFCVTSWSVHLSPKTLQYPLWEFAAKRLNAPSPDAAADFDEAVARRWGAIPFGVLDGLSHWGVSFIQFDSRIPGGVKSGDPAPAGFLAQRLAALDRRKGGRAALLKEIASTRDAIRAATGDAAAAVSAKPPYQGALLGLAFLDTLEAVLTGKVPPAEPRDLTLRHYGAWQPPRSAERARALAWSALEQAQGAAR